MIIRKDFGTSRFRNSCNGCYKYGIDGNFLYSFFVILVKLNKELRIYHVNNNLCFIGCVLICIFTIAKVLYICTIKCFFFLKY